MRKPPEGSNSLPAFGLSWLLGRQCEDAVSPPPTATSNFESNWNACAPKRNGPSGGHSLRPLTLEKKVAGAQADDVY
jgi:hypothetical protein